MNRLFLALSLIWLCSSAAYPQEQDYKNLVALSSDSPLEISGISINSESVGVYEKFEITFQLGGQWENPFDPDQIRVDALITKPDGHTIVLPGFFYQDYHLNSYQELEKIDDPVWKVRFTPEMTGEFTYRLRAVNNGNEVASTEGTFTSAAFDAHHGYLKVSKSNPLYFEFDDGTPFFGIAMDRIAADADGCYPRFAHSGGNFNRLFLTNGRFDIQELNRDPERPDRGLGKMNLEHSWHLDQLLELGEQLGIYHMLTLTNQYNFNRQWEIHAYNKANGGILDSKNEYFINEEAMQYFEKYLRYMVARYGFSTAVFSWDLWNEYSAMGIDVDIAIPWHLRMAHVIDSLDVFNHVIHTNDGKFNGSDKMHALPEMEVVSTNTYAIKDIAYLASLWTERMIKTFNKPYVLTEYGMGHNFPPGAYGGMDPERRMVHNGLWSPVMSGSASTGMPWEANWLNDRIFYNYLKAVKKMVEDVPFSKRNWTPVSIHSFNFHESRPSYYADVIVEGWPGNFELNVEDAPEVYKIDAHGRVQHQESLSATLTGIEEGRPDQTSTVKFSMNYPTDGAFAVYVTELRESEPTPQLTVDLDGERMVRAELTPLDMEDYHPIKYNQYFTVNVPAGAHTIGVSNSGGGRIITSFELINYLPKSGPDLEVRGLQSDDFILLWLKNQKFTVLHEMVGIGLQTQPEGVLELQKVPNGTWMAEWVNTINASTIRTELVESDNHTLVLQTPPVKESIAVRLRKF